LDQSSLDLSPLLPQESSPQVEVVASNPGHLLFTRVIGAETLIGR